MSNFIDSAKLEAVMESQAAHVTPSSRELFRLDFMAGSAAYAALLDAETTEDIERVYEGHDEDGNIRRRWALGPIWEGERAQTRRVLYGPWLPSEGGEKP